jgi:hypothetical protein
MKMMFITILDKIVDWLPEIFMVLMVLCFIAVAKHESLQNEKCKSLNGVYIDGKCLDLKEIK